MKHQIIKLSLLIATILNFYDDVAVLAVKDKTASAFAVHDLSKRCLPVKEKRIKNFPRDIRLSASRSYWGAIDASKVSYVAGRLYPFSTVPILFQNYLWTRPEMACPKGAVVGFISQTISIFMLIPIVAITSKLTDGAPFVNIDWLHGIEQILMAFPVHIMAMSFRQAALSQEAKRALPKSATSYKPMIKTSSVLYTITFLIGIVHKIFGGKQWASLRFLFFEPPTFGMKGRLEGALSFAVWIPHWIMIFDFIAQLHFMRRWAEYTKIREWETLAWLHFPYAFVYVIVVLDHLHRNRIQQVRLLHPVFVFLGSITSLTGALLVARANGFSIMKNKDGAVEGKSTAKEVITKADPPTPRSSYPNWDPSYSARSCALAALMSYISIHLTQ